MEVASGAIAVMQLCFQIADSVQRVRTFVRSVKEAPEQLQRLIDKIDFLWQLLSKVKDIIERQRTLSDHHASMALISTALAPCVSSVKRLEDNVDKLRGGLEHPSTLQRKRYALRSVTRKEILGELSNVVQESVSNLQAVLMVEAIELQLHTSQSLQSLRHHPQPSQAASPPLDIKRRPRTPFTRIHEFNVLHNSTFGGCQAGMLKSVEMKARQSILGKIHIQKERSYRGGRAECTQRWSLIISAPFLPSYVEWQSLDTFGHISRTLTCYPMLSYSRSHLDNCFRGDATAFQNALQRREISPFARDGGGGTLLHLAAMAGSLELCSLLIQLGADPNQTKFNGRTPFQSLRFYSAHSLVSCMRLLLEAQRDATEEDLDEFYSTYNGPTDAPEMMFVYDTDFDNILSRQNFRATALHMAVRNLVFGRREWYGLTRRLLRRNFDIHAQDRLGHSPLDELLKTSGCHCSSQTAIATWLTILSEESFDVVAYLQEEMTLGVRKNHILCNGCPWIRKGSHFVFEAPVDPRKGIRFNELNPPKVRLDLHEAPLGYWGEIMVFKLDPPLVWLDYHFDLKSPASLVWHEFGHFTSYHDDGCSKMQGLWPFEFPSWTTSLHHRWFYAGKTKADSRIMYGAWANEKDLVRSRRERRVEKKAQKLARSQRHRGPRLIPGAWIG